MNGKITFLLAIAVLVISTAEAQYGYNDYNTYYNEGPNNNDYDVTSIGTGVQEASNVHSKKSSNQNVGRNIAAKSDVENEQIAQSEEEYGAPPPPPPPRYY